MRRFLFGMVIASVAAVSPCLAFGGDREIAQAIMARLEQQKADGLLKGFDFDLNVENGKVVFTGKVADAKQRTNVLSAAEAVPGIVEVVNNLEVISKDVPASPVAAPSVKTAVANAAKEGFSLAEAVKNSVMAPSAVQLASDTQSTGPTAQDQAITKQIVGTLGKAKSQGVLKGFDLDVSTVNGDVWVRGFVADAAQRDFVMQTIRSTSGVSQVIDDVSVRRDSAVRTVATEMPSPMADPAAAPMQSYGSMPNMGPVMGPRPFAPSMLTSAPMPQEGYAGGPSGGPVPMQGAAAPYGSGAPRYDQPYMPSYAWPSYAAYPNYAAVTYPKQYSPSAWPYIGPFYPYPQVPLGWRKVTLEWDDGLWQLDFNSK